MMPPMLPTVQMLAPFELIPETMFPGASPFVAAEIAVAHVFEGETKPLVTMRAPDMITFSSPIPFAATNKIIGVEFVKTFIPPLVLVVPPS